MRNGLPGGVWNVVQAMQRMQAPSTQRGTAIDRFARSRGLGRTAVPFPGGVQPMSPGMLPRTPVSIPLPPPKTLY